MNDTGAPEQIEREITDLLFAVLGLMRHHLGSAVSEVGLTPQQAHALRCLVPGDALPMRDLATELMCDASTVTGIVDRLEERGLVRRQPDPADRRVKALVVTDAGVAARNHLWDRVLAGAPHVAGLSPDQRVMLRDLLRQVVAAAPEHGCSAGLGHPAAG